MSLELLRAQILPLRQALLTHPIYQDMQDPRSLRIFMQYHVFAVWDFMSLLKALQQRLTCVTVPWVASASNANCRFINEIVLGEESDEDGAGGYCSHFDLYLRAMRQFRADTGPIDSLTAGITAGQALIEALPQDGAAAPIRHFVSQTFEFIDSGDVCVIASAFTFGREDLLPGVFQRIVDELSELAPGELDLFRYYLKRHIDLDGGEHGPMSEKLITSLCGTDAVKWAAAIDTALASLTARLNFWDAIHGAILRAGDA